MALIADCTNFILKEGFFSTFLSGLEKGFSLSRFSSVLLSTIITLFPIINPVGTSFLLNDTLSKFSNHDRHKVSVRIAFFSFLMGIVTLLFGKYILLLFGISISTVQFTGGLLLAYSGWHTLQSEVESEHIEEYNLMDIRRKIFYPLTFPLTFGAGAIAALLGLATRYDHRNWSINGFNEFAIAIGILITSTALYFFYMNTAKVTRYLKEEGKTALNKIAAFLVLSVGVEILVDAISKIIKRF